MKWLHLAAASGRWTKTLDHAGEQLVDFVPKLVLAAIVVLLGALLIRILLTIVRRSLAAGKVEPTRGSLVVSACRFGGWIVLFAAAFWILGLKTVSAALAGSTVLGALALGMGASGTTADILAGIFLVADREVAVGRRVAGAGVEGTVEAISVRKTMIRGDDGTLHLVPNRVLDAAAYSVKAGARESRDSSPRSD